jgi:hypothetical protein
MQPGQETVENQHLDLESEAEAQENQKFQPSPRHLELLQKNRVNGGIFIIHMPRDAIM